MSKIDLHILEGGTRRQTKTLEMLMEVHQKIRKNELPILYFARENSAMIVNSDEYTKQMTLLELYRKVRKQVEEYNDTPNKTPKVLHLALDIQETLDKIDELEEELDE